MIRRTLFALCLFCIATIAMSAQTVIGKWKTIDDDGVTEKSIVEIFEKDGKIYGRVLEVYPDPGEPDDPVCQKCEGDRKGEKIRGLEVIREMELGADGTTYEGGKILDPENGKEYTCKMWIEDGDLKVRGYISFFYRTQTWLPAD